MTVHLDISQLVLDPRRSGIQRAERELIRHWPGPAPLRPCRFHEASGSMHELPHRLLDVLCEDAPPGGRDAELLRIAPLLRHGPVVQPTRLLSAELFLDPARAAYYNGFPEPDRLFWLVYDFLPWLDPGWFGAGAATRLMPYLRALRAVPNLAFISARTRDDCATRVFRKAVSGPVIPMGGDGLGLERQTFDPARRSFVMLGTVEARKNAGTAMLAFQRLWAEGVDVRLVMIGGVDLDSTLEMSLLSVLAGEPRFRHLRNLPDTGVREALRGARAMLFPSDGEGFGIPPMEALHAGIPVIVSAALPAIAALPGAGQVRLAAVTPESIAAAVRLLLDDAAARRMWDDAVSLNVPGWADFAQRVADWVQA